MDMQSRCLRKDLKDIFLCHNIFTSISVTLDLFIQTTQMKVDFIYTEFHCEFLNKLGTTSINSAGVESVQMLPEFHCGIPFEEMR